jgi:hypothetical protein
MPQLEESVSLLHIRNFEGTLALQLHFLQSQFFQQSATL